MKSCSVSTRPCWVRTDKTAARAWLVRGQLSVYTDLFLRVKYTADLAGHIIKRLESYVYRLKTSEVAALPPNVGDVYKPSVGVGKSCRHDGTLHDRSDLRHIRQRLEIQLRLQKQLNGVVLPCITDDNIAVGYMYI